MAKVKQYVLVNSVFQFALLQIRELQAVLQSTATCVIYESSL